MHASGRQRILWRHQRHLLFGEPSPAAIHVTEVARQALEIGIAAVRPGARVGDIGHAIQTFVESKGCSVVRTSVATASSVGSTSAHRHTRSGQRAPSSARHNVTIGPMVNLGSWETEILDDDWTAVTRDGSLSARFEHPPTPLRGGGADASQYGSQRQRGSSMCWAADVRRRSAKRGAAQSAQAGDGSCTAARDL